MHLLYNNDDRRINNINLIMTYLCILYIEVSTHIKKFFSKIDLREKN